MRIRLEKSGGVTGVRMTVTIDSKSLSPEDAKKMHDLVEGCRFFELPQETADFESGADRVLYQLTVEAEGKRHTVRFGETAASRELRALIQWATKAARRSRRPKEGGAKE